MNIRGECILSICGENIDFTMLEKTLGLIPNKVVLKGSKITSNRNAATNIWSYKRQINDMNECEKVLKQLAEIIIPKVECLNKLPSGYNVEINCYLRSDFAQMGFCLDHELISMLNEIGLTVNFHILSFGMVENN